MAERLYTNVKFEDAVRILANMGRMTDRARDEKGVLFHCPNPRHVNGDRNPSLWIREVGDGDAEIVCSCEMTMLELKQILGLWDEVPEHTKWSREKEQECFRDLFGESFESGSTEFETHLPAWFWTETTDTILRIKQWADSRYFSADALLGSVLAYVSAWTRHNILTPDVGKGPGSMNYFVLILGRSGESKSEAISNGREFLGVNFIQRNPGPTDVSRSKFQSGQGLVRNYGIHSKDDLTFDIPGAFKTPEFQQTVWSRMFISDEGNEVFIEATRQGNTLFEQMRTGWSGHELQDDYVTAEKKAYLPQNSYRMSALIGIQYEGAQVLFSKGQASGGTTQRFLWVPAQPSPHFVEGTTTPASLRWQPLEPQSFVKIDGTPFWTFSIETAIEQEYRAKMRKIFDANRAGSELDFNLDGHALYTQLKTACLFAHLEKRTHVSSTEWQMAAELMKVSFATRERAKAYGLEQERVAKRARRNEQAQVELVKYMTIQDDVLDDVLKVAKRVYTIVSKAGEAGASRGVISQKLGKAGPRAHLDSAIEVALVRNWIIADGTRYKLGSSQPAS